MITGISVVINTRNEEESLPRALSSVKEFASEIVVVDMESSDRSVEVAKKFGAKIFHHKFVNYVEPVRNFAISKANGPWILILDPDEEIPPTLVDELKKLSQKDATYYRLARKNIIFNKWIKSSRWWPDYLIRFFKKGSVSWSDEIHSIPITIGPGRDLEAKKETAIIHHHYDSLEKYLSWANRYADVRVKELQSRSYKFVWGDLLQKPTGEFLSRYFFGDGYKEGVHGLAIALLQSFAEFMVYVKLWQQKGFPEEDVDLGEISKELTEVGRQFRYWQSDAIIGSNQNLINKLRARLLRKFSSK